MKKLIIVFSALMLIFSFAGCKAGVKTVVVYTSVDQVYSEKIFKEFEQQTGIKVKPVYDIEASKTVGLVNRLISEKNNPQADVFWNGEILQTIALKENGVLEKADSAAAGQLPEAFKDKDNYWFGFGGRARTLIVNKALIPLESCPKTLSEIAGSKYIKGIGIAYPVFGTTSTHTAALYAYWGDDRTREFFRTIKDAGISVVEGNSVVKDFVSQKKLFMGLTDTDDALSEMQKNKDLDIVFLDQSKDDVGTLVIPNTVAKIKSGPNQAQADVFIDFLLSPETEQMLVDDGWIHIPVHPGVTASDELPVKDIKIMQVDFNEAYKKLETSKKDMTEIFVR